MTQIEITKWKYWTRVRSRVRTGVWTWTNALARARDYKPVALGDMIHNA